MKKEYTNKIKCPYRVCPLGAHIDHQLGRITGFALDKGITIEYNITDDGSVDIESRNYGGRFIANIHDVLEKQFTWSDYLSGAIYTLGQKYSLEKGIEGVVYGELPAGGLSSSAAVIIVYLLAICNANGIHLTQPEIIATAIKEEREYIGVNVGKLDQSCEVYSKQNHLLYMDMKDDSCQLIPTNPKMEEFEIAIIFTGKERQLVGSGYNTRVDECKAAAYGLLAYADMNYGRYADTVLRDVPYGIYQEYAKFLPSNWHKRAEHFYTEMQRVKDGVQAWKAGDIEKFGRLVYESGASSIYNYETGSKELITLHNIMKQVNGIYGARFSGAGFNGCSLALVDVSAKEKVAQEITERYLKLYPEYKGRFFVTYCKTADGVKIV